MRFVAIAGLVLMTVSTVGAEGGAAGSNGPAPLISRYEVREDAQTGRLVRVVARKSPQRTSNRRGGIAASKQVVVQGDAAKPARLSATGKVDVDALVRQAARRYDVDPKLIHAVIRQESNYDPFAVSPKGAAGLMQLLPVTAARFGVQDIFDPAENVRGGVKYLRKLLDRYDGDPSLSLAAYNAGEGAVDRYGGIPPYRETVDYVGRVRRSYDPAAPSVPATESGQTALDTGRPRIVSWIEPSGLIRFETESE